MGFYGLYAQGGPRRALPPRADSEVVCEAAIELLKDAEAPVVYDLCAGTGCLGLGIARHLPGAAVTCVEKSADAWPYLTANVAGTGVQAVQDDIFTYYNRLPSGGADLIISNPPLPDGGGDGTPDAGDGQGACYGAGRRRGRPRFFTAC